MKKINKNNVIIACDFSTQKELDRFLLKFKEVKPFIKIGYQLYYSLGNQVVQQYKKQGYKIFLDLKLHDIPNTVEKGVEALTKLNVDLLSIHAAGGIKMMTAAKKAAKKTKIIAITQLTSTDKKTLKNELLITKSMETTVIKYAKNAKAAGIDGVVCSALEAKNIKKQIKSKFLLVTPGIRYQNSKNNDQKRVVEPSVAAKNGVDYIVVGRIITESKNPLEMYCKILKDFNIYE